MKRGAIKQDLRILYLSQGSTNCVNPENMESMENTKNMEMMENIKKTLTSLC